MKLLVDILVLPPFNLILLAAVGLFLLRRRRRSGIVLVSISLVLLYAFSTPLVGSLLARSVRAYEALDASAVAEQKAQAIVILGAGKYLDAPEYFGDTIRGHALERVRYGAFLHRRTGIPILVTGGDPFNTGSSEAQLMKAVLEEEFGVAVKWSEDESNNTLESALDSRSLLQGEGIDTILLVTHADHMARATWAFRHAGFHPIPAPTIVQGASRFEVLDLLPRASAMHESALALREWIGRAWYTIRN
jgi:uncharacterized SAM-binding protein YcdF (DUF218 family)